MCHVFGFKVCICNLAFCKYLCCLINVLVKLLFQTMESQMFGSSFDALKVDLCKYQKHLHLLVTMAQESIKKTQGVRALLYMKSDKAKETMKTIVTDHQNQLRTIAYKFEQDIN